MSVARTAATISAKHDITVDVASLDDGNHVLTTVTVPGVKLGDCVVCVKPTDDGVYPLHCAVSAADTVKVTFFNPSGGTVNAASQTMYFFVL